jgi:hypothetical protein
LLLLLLLVLGLPCLQRQCPVAAAPRQVRASLHCLLLRGGGCQPLLNDSSGGC